jgi:hypothetical protein
VAGFGDNRLSARADTLSGTCTHQDQAQIKLRARIISSKSFSSLKLFRLPAQFLFMSSLLAALFLASASPVLAQVPDVFRFDQVMWKSEQEVMNPLFSIVNC